jgi:hypothetical protein
MPSEHDETRARQIEALRQYVTQLSEQRGDPEVEVGMRLPDVTAERRRRPPLSWLVTGLLVAVALVGGVLGGATTVVSPTQNSGSGVALVASPECKTAVDRANQVLAVAVRMRAALAQGATVASGDPASFDRALAAYRQVVDRCELRAP